jgi:hypothetical protein
MNYKGDMVDAPKDLETVVAALDDQSIVWSFEVRDGIGLHQVRYCLEVKHFSNYELAADCFKDAMIHRATCEGHLDCELSEELEEA